MYSAHLFFIFCHPKKTGAHFTWTRTIHGPKPALIPKNYRSLHYYEGILRLHYLCLSNVLMLKYQHKKRKKLELKKHANVNTYYQSRWIKNIKYTVVIILIETNDSRGQRLMALPVGSAKGAHYTT